MIHGLDSAYEPTLAQAQAAKAQGITFWGCYRVGPGALHNWSDVGLVVLKTVGIAPLPIYVPKLDLSTDPTTDAQAFAADLQAQGISGGAGLDTEASMRGNPHLISYEATFGDTLALLGFSPFTYAGGFEPAKGIYPKHAPWWIIPGATTVPDGQCYQTGSGTFAGMSVDFDIAGPGFPLGSFVQPSTKEPEVFFLIPTTNPDAQPTNIPGDPTVQDVFFLGFDAISLVSVSAQVRIVAHKADGSDGWAIPPVYQGATPSPLPPTAGGDGVHFTLTKGWPLKVVRPVGYDSVSLRVDGGTDIVTVRQA